LSSPFVVFAAARTFRELANQIISIVNIAVPVLVSLAVVAFFFGLVKFLSSTGDTKKHKDGITIMTYGIISLFVIVGLWGIIEIAKNTIFGNDSVAVPSSSEILGSFNGLNKN